MGRGDWGVALQRARRIWVWPFHIGAIGPWLSKVEEDLGHGLFLALVWSKDRRHISWCPSIMPG